MRGMANIKKPAPKSTSPLSARKTASPARRKQALVTVADSDQNRRADLVRISAKLFREKGFDATTIRDIADAVGMRSGSPFYHFKSKQDILLAVMEEGLAAGLETTEAIVARDLPSREKFRALVHAHLETVLADGHDFIPVLLYDWRSLNLEYQGQIIKLKDRYDALWQDVLGELKRDGWIADDSRVVRLLLLGAINYSAQWYKPGKGLSISQLTDKTLSFFLKEKP